MSRARASAGGRRSTRTARSCACRSCEGRSAAAGRARSSASGVIIFRPCGRPTLPGPPRGAARIRARRRWSSPARRGDGRSVGAASPARRRSSARRRRRRSYPEPRRLRGLAGVSPGRHRPRGSAAPRIPGDPARAAQRPGHRAPGDRRDDARSTGHRPLSAAKKPLQAPRPSRVHVPDADPARRALNLAKVPRPLVDQLAAAVTGVVATIPGQELVAVDLVYHSMQPGDDEPDPIDVFGCSRRRRDEILGEEPPPPAWSTSGATSSSTRTRPRRTPTCCSARRGWRPTSSLSRSTSRSTSRTRCSTSHGCLDRC